MRLQQEYLRRVPILDGILPNFRAGAQNHAISSICIDNTSPAQQNVHHKHTQVGKRLITLSDAFLQRIISLHQCLPMKFHGKRRRHLIEISYSSQYHVRKNSYVAGKEKSNTMLSRRDLTVTEDKQPAAVKKRCTHLRRGHTSRC